MDHTASHYASNGARPLTGLFSDLWRQTSRLARAEAELAKEEISQKVSEVGTGVASVATGGAVLFAGFIVLLFAAVGALQMVMDTGHDVWLAPLIVGAVVALAGYIALKKGRKELTASNLKPGRTLDSLRSDARFVKEHVK